MITIQNKTGALTTLWQCKNRDWKIFIIWLPAPVFHGIFLFYSKMSFIGFKQSLNGETIIFAVLSA